MNIIIFVIFAFLLVLFVVFMFVIKKTSINGVAKVYFRNYYSNAFREEDRKFNWFFFIALGLLPYFLGALLFLSFPSVLMNLDVNLLLQIDIILLTIFCLFIGFDFKREDKEVVKNELIATLLINILFVVISVLCLLIASTIEMNNQTQTFDKILKYVMLTIYYALNFKIFVMFFYSLKRVFILSSKTHCTKDNGDDELNGQDKQ